MDVQVDRLRIGDVVNVPVATGFGFRDVDRTIHAIHTPTGRPDDRDVHFTDGSCIRYRATLTVTVIEFAGAADEEFEGL